MSIYDYIKKKHPAGFIGYRVSVMVDSVHKQKYFNTKGMTGHERLSKYLKATRLHNEWLALKAIAETKRTNKAIPTKRCINSTGVRGISTRNAPEGKRYTVNGSYQKAQFHKVFPFTQEGWKAAVKYLAKKKHLKNWKHLLERKTNDF